ncbi:MAG TPA: nucleotidyltransferase domain-containing protein [Acidimicrobiales bacterium]|jgi:hypothetical protein|nr:nucleotidyltransferase domain-containing protein [Acidimicrobiales bacterium]
MADGIRGVVQRRRSEQAGAFQVALGYATALGAEIPLAAAVVFGSYARGDFNTWSDIDVLVISDALPVDARDRADLLWRHQPARISAVGWTVGEHRDRRRRRDPIAVEADAVGVTVVGALPAL